MVNYEQDLISKLFQASKADVTRAINLLSPSEFRSYPQEAQFIWRHVDTYSTLPSYSTFKKEFPDFKKTKCPEEIGYYLDKVRTVSIGVLNKTHGQAVFKKMQEPGSSPAEVAVLVDRWFSSLKDSELALKGGVPYNYGSEDKFKRYQFRATGQGVFFEFPLPSMKSLLYRLYAGEVFTFGGRTAVGKSWMLCYLANAAARHQGLRTLVVSREMSSEEIIDRCDAFNLRLPWRRFRRGELTAGEELKYKIGIKKLEKENIPFEVIGSEDDNFDMKLVETYIRDYRADIVFVDGAHLIDAQGKTETERTYARSRMFKKLARKCNVIAVQSVQIGKAFEDEKGHTKVSGLIGLSWGDAVAQDSDVVAEVVAPQGKDSMLRLFSVSKARNETTGQFYFNQTMDPVAISEMTGGVDDVIEISYEDG